MARLCSAENEVVVVEVAVTALELRTTKARLRKE